MSGGSSKSSLSSYKELTILNVPSLVDAVAGMLSLSCPVMMPELTPLQHAQRPSQAGGLSNILPELAHDLGLGAASKFCGVLAADSFSPMKVRCNESQEQCALAICV